MNKELHRPVELIVSIRMAEYGNMCSQINVKQQSLNTILGVTLAVLGTFVTAAASLAGNFTAFFWIVGFVIPFFSLSMLFLIFVESDLIAMMGFRCKEIEDAVNELIGENVLFFENATRIQQASDGHYKFLPKYPIYYAIFLTTSFLSSLCSLFLLHNRPNNLSFLLGVPILSILTSFVSTLLVIKFSHRKFRLYKRW